MGSRFLVSAFRVWQAAGGVRIVALYVSDWVGLAPSPGV